METPAKASWEVHGLASHGWIIFLFITLGVNCSYTLFSQPEVYATEALDI